MPTASVGECDACLTTYSEFALTLLIVNEPAVGLLAKVGLFDLVRCSGSCLTLAATPTMVGARVGGRDLPVSICSSQFSQRPGLL